MKPDTLTTEHRRMAFHRMVKRDDEVEEILKANIEIDSNIDDKVTVVLNSCL